MQKQEKEQSPAITGTAEEYVFILKNVLKEMSDSDIVEKAVRNYFKKNPIMYNSELKSTIEIRVIRDENGKPIRGFYSFLYGVIKVMYDYYIEKYDSHGNKITQKLFVEQIGLFFNCDMTYFRPDVYRLKDYPCWVSLKETIEGCIKS